MDRRSFITALIGGMTFTSIGGVATANAAQTPAAPEPAAGQDVPAEVAEKLEGADAEFSQYYRRRRFRRRYYRPRFYRRRYYRRRFYGGRRRVYRRYW